MLDDDHIEEVTIDTIPHTKKITPAMIFCKLMGIF